MSFIQITQVNTDNAKLRLHPSRSFSSSSSGVTGSVRVIAQSSPFFKEVTDNSPFVDSPMDATTVESFREPLFSLTGSGLDITSASMEYLHLVNSSSEAARQTKYVEILRFTPTNTFTSDTLRKSVFRKNLIPRYKASYPDLEYAFTNYQSFNFVSSSNFPSASALIYPDPLDNYMVSTGFTFAFNAKLNRVPKKGMPYTAGTVLFRSSSYALSLVSGSKRDSEGKVAAFRILLQLSSAAELPPSEVSLASLPANTFLSSDNVLKRNHWHNIAISWGKDHNAGSGSFFIDGIKDVSSEFKVGTSAINLGYDPFNVVMLGAHFSGSNSQLSGFFNSAVSSEGVYSGGGGVEPPSAVLSASRFNGEMNDISVYSSRLSDDLIFTGSSTGATTLPKGLVFYVPCFFVKESPRRKSLLTPFQQETTGTQEPFNAKLSFGVAGRDINLQNFCREFVQKKYPRLYFLTASTIAVSTATYSANSFLLDIGSNKLMHRAREMFVLPSDNGKFVPGWSLLESGSDTQRPTGSSPMSLFVGDNGIKNLGIVSLNSLISTSSIFDGLTQTTGDGTGTDSTSKFGLLQEILGASPENASVSTGSGYTILQRTRDPSSDEVVFFDASNLFYGNSIQPKSYSMFDTELSGTSNTLSMRINENGRGNLFRADCESPHATWSSVGGIIYEEGISCVMHPAASLFGKDQFSIELNGDQNLYTYEVNVPALQGMLNSSSNPGYRAGTRDNYASSYEGDAVTISSIVFHDENFNVVARTVLAQPILKTQFDKYMFRVKFDF